jgi:D-amino-acid dehydrogenase
MKVIVLGGGVVGVTSAWYLSRLGHEVTVIDRQDAAAMETSFGNAGEISPGYASPWAGPHVPLKVVKWLTMKHGPFIFRPSVDPAMWRWLLQMLGNCTTEAYRRNKGRMVRLAEYSRDQLRDLRTTTGITYDERTLGTLQLFRTQPQLDAVPDDTKVLDEFAVPYQVLDRAGCIQAEPALALVSERFVTTPAMKPATATSSPSRSPQWPPPPGWCSATPPRSAASSPKATRSPASPPAPAC